MKIKRSWFISFLTVITFLTLSACSDKTESGTKKDNDIEQNTKMDHSTMDHSSSGEVPVALKTAVNPKFPEGSTAIITNGHMEGMEGAKATIVGAYDTTAYIVSYDPATGGERVENHKWVIHEELINPDLAPLASGTEVKTNASHMKGMENATVRIDKAVQTTVYMIDYTATTNGDSVKNHKWVTEDELKAE
ncbi:MULTISPECIES: YdhK family protein [Lysinibacillus]|uniref:YdhK family protein n=1 Tax=Lysinibacillus TaxID=400634 RepID=UPI00257DA77D|nr:MULTISPECIES: YdhK family protein [Lysinibacillus]